ncbi:MAG: hypothetical protein R3C53_04830 [Pirellulaceae bacterium]
MAYLCTAAASVAWPRSWWNWVVNAILTFLIVMQLRLWDDLATVETDRRIYPERVLCAAQSLRGFWLLLAMLLLINAMLVAIFKNTNALVVFLLLMAFLAGWYRILNCFSRYPMLGSVIVLAKYPSVVVMLSVQTWTGISKRMGLVAAVTFLCFFVYEILHDHQLHARKIAKVTLALALLALLLLGAWLVVELIPVSYIAAVFQAIFVASGACIVWLGDYAGRTSPAKKQTSNFGDFAVFLVTFVWLLNYGLATLPRD